MVWAQRAAAERRGPSKSCSNRREPARGAVARPGPRLSSSGSLREPQLRVTSGTLRSSAQGRSDTKEQRKRPIRQERQLLRIPIRILLASLEKVAVRSAIRTALPRTARRRTPRDLGAATLRPRHRGRRATWRTATACNKWDTAFGRSGVVRIRLIKENRPFAEPPERDAEG